SPRFTVAGAPPPAAFIERLERELGWQFIQIYGLTETSPLLTVSSPDHYTREDDWVRRAHAGVEGIGVDIEVRDHEDRPVARDEHAVGEVCARAHVSLRGLWGQ